LRFASRIWVRTVATETPRSAATSFAGWPSARRSTTLRSAAVRRSSSALGSAHGSALGPAGADGRAEPAPRPRARTSPMLGGPHGGAERAEEQRQRDGDGDQRGKVREAVTGEPDVKPGGAGHQHAAHGPEHHHDNAGDRQSGRSDDRREAKQREP
jgi:hypothetical protein